mmetsp:Transcript_1251/g.2955  ORF Transcript_1251/g.2955 Transcript_1251/m.2955 type:complete len:170 (+) Transcript_1251:695-1204(+)
MHPRAGRGPDDNDERAGLKSDDRTAGPILRSVVCMAATSGASHGAHNGADASPGVGLAQDILDPLLESCGGEGCLPRFARALLASRAERVPPEAPPKNGALVLIGKARRRMDITDDAHHKLRDHGNALGRIRLRVRVESQHAAAREDALLRVRERRRLHLVCWSGMIHR